MNIYADYIAPIRTEKTIYSKAPFFNVRKIKYGDIYKVDIFPRGKTIPATDPYAKKSENNDYTSVNLFKTKQRISDIILSNSWDWWGTITIDKNLHDRYDIDTLQKYFTQTFNNLKKRKIAYKDMYYICVPEKHKDGAYHFHLLLGGITDNKDFKKTKRISKKSKKTIFNWTISHKKFGRYDAWIPLETKSDLTGRLKISNYMGKYISKDLLIERKNKNKFWASRNLKRPSKNYEYVPESKLFNDLYLWVVDKKKYNVLDYYETFSIDKFTGVVSETPRKISIYFDSSGKNIKLLNTIKNSAVNSFNKEELFKVTYTPYAMYLYNYKNDLFIEKIKNNTIDLTYIDYFNTI